MKIGIMSDIQDNAEGLILAVKRFNKEKCDLVVCCGDWGSASMPNFCANLRCKIISVFGNNDADVYQFLTRKIDKNWNIEFNKICVEFEIDNKKIVVYHGESDILLRALVNCGEYDMVLSGHNHKPLVIQIKNTTHINPGSIVKLHSGKPGGDSTIAIHNTKTNKSNIIKLI